MRRAVDFTIVECTPDLDALLRRETGGTQAPPRLSRLFREALTWFDRLAAPRGIVAPVTGAEFADIYAGEGLNAPAAPLAEIFPRAERLALFAATSGAPLSEEIGALFSRGEPALGYALDVIASEATTLLADALAERFERLVRDEKPTPSAARVRVLPYSPGYCGWHVTGQRRLFAALQPDRIGIVLGTSCLMRPLKSVSGVLVAGVPAAHRFKPAYPFCSDCTTHECRGRMASVLRKTP